MKISLFKKLVSLFLAVLLFVNPLVVRIAYAEEEVISITETGDAKASAETQTEANTNTDIIPGEVTVPEGNCTPPEGQTACDGDIEIENENTAAVAGTADAFANTGGITQVGDEGDVLVDTGDATASGELDSRVNTNLVLIEPSPTSIPSGTLPEVVSLSVENTNEGTVENKAEVIASTGENTVAVAQGDAKILTGDALSWANVLNFLNTNIVGSNFEILVIDVDGNYQSIDLNRVWQEILEKGTTDSLEIVSGSDVNNLQFIIRNKNDGTLVNKIDVSAETGDNQAVGNQNACVETGDATALANVANVVNTNLVGSKFLLSIINFLSSSEADLILPRPEGFLTGQTAGSPLGGVDFANDNLTEMDNKMVSLADSGNNQVGQNGQSETLTGNADSLANSFNVINTNVWQNNWFFLLVNNLGKWEGRIISWQNPSGNSAPVLGSQTFEISPEEQNLLPKTESEDETVFNNENKAKIENQINVSALTGNNIVGGNSEGGILKTGSAWSVANLFNLINTNIFGGKWFVGIVNILGKWTGDLVFAYPDVLVSLEKTDSEVEIGGTTEFNVFYQNSGTDLAKDVKINIQLPAGFTYLSDLSGLPAEVSGQDISWSVGGLEIGQEGKILIMVKVDPDFNFDQTISFWQKLVHPVMAAENLKEKEVQITAQIKTVDPESDLNNNSSSFMTIVYQPAPISGENKDESVDQRQPNLEITSWNNVNGFVYPGDTVTFEITIQNTSDVPVYNAVVEQNLFNGAPEGFGTIKFEIGTVEPGRRGTLSFGLKMPKEGIEAGSYRAIARAFGNAKNGNIISSNEARSDFNIRFKFVTEVVALEPEEWEGEVLGEATVGQLECKSQKEILPYVLLFLLSSGWLIEKNRNLLKEKRLYGEK